MAKRGILEHPKTIELAEILDIPECYVVGLLECFWHHVARYFPHGEVTSLRASVLARSIRYPGDPAHLWASLLEVGFLDQTESGRVFVHDWSEHADNAVHQLLKKRGEVFSDGASPFSRERIRADREPLTPSGERVMPVSQTVHEPVTNRSRLPEPKPKPEPNHDDEELSLANSARAHEDAGLSSSSSSEPPERMPDGTRRLTEEQLRLVESLQSEFSSAVVVGSSVSRQYRLLFAAGLTPALLDEIVREAAALKRRAAPAWRAGTMAYFLPALKRALEEEQAPAATGNGAPLNGKRPAAPSAIPDWYRDKAPPPAPADLIDGLPPLKPLCGGPG